MGFQGLLKSKQNNSASADLLDLIRREDWRLVIMDCKTLPMDASKWTVCKGFFDGEHDSRVLPIHMACSLNCPSEVVNTLVECYPQGIQMREQAFQRLPLHIACQTNASVATTEAIVHHFPEATRAKDRFGRLPIHYACSHGAPAAVLDILLREFPTSVGCRDDYGWIPLHVACRRGVPLHVIEKLLARLPESMEMATNKGSTPIICARQGGQKDIIDFLENYVQSQPSPVCGVQGNIRPATKALS